jgi:hypothetical protein
MGKVIQSEGPPQGVVVEAAFEQFLAGLDSDSLAQDRADSLDQYMGQIKYLDPTLRIMAMQRAVQKLESIQEPHAFQTVRQVMNQAVEASLTTGDGPEAGLEVLFDTQVMERPRPEALIPPYLPRCMSPRMEAGASRSGLRLSAPSTASTPHPVSDSSPTR